ncbi:MAG: YkvA family protein [Pseudomonadota bacterium]
MNEKNYSASYSDENFWNKITKMPETAGCSVLRAAFTLYVLLREASTPLWAKTVIVGVLGYLICPVDAIPDIIPGVGFTDDLVIMTLLIGQLYAYINNDVRKKIDSMLPERCQGAYGIEPDYKS